MGPRQSFLQLLHGLRRSRSQRGPSPSTGGPLAGSTVTLWAASSGEPRQLAQSKSGSNGRFELDTKETPGNDVVLYVIAKGGEATVNKGSGYNPAIALLTVLVYERAQSPKRQRYVFFQ